MKYMGFKKNDIANGEGVCVSLWTAGCPHRCPGCHNPQTWDYNNGIEVPKDLKFQIIKAISENDVERNFSVLGGEPFASWNLDFVYEIVSAVRTAYPNIKIYIWSGYTYKELLDINNPKVKMILDKCDVLIDGPFEESKKELGLKLRGSYNQNIINLTNK